jgi:hypothetical protein
MSALAVISGTGMQQAWGILEAFFALTPATETEAATQLVLGVAGAFAPCTKHRSVA